MADQSDVEAALVAQILAILYPGGVTAGSVTGGVCRVYRGWPLSAALNADLAAGVVNVSVLPVASSLKTRPVFGQDGWIGPAVAPSLTVSVAASQVSFAGSAGPGQLAGVMVNGAPYVYRSQTGDGPAQVAAALAAMMAPHMAVSCGGAVLNVPANAEVIARTAADVVQWQEIRRQVQGFSLAFWCPTPQVRDRIVSLVDMSLAGIKFLTLADGSAGRLMFGDTSSSDQNQSGNLYRRDLIYHVEYATTVSVTGTQRIFGGLGMDGATSYA